MELFKTAMAYLMLGAGAFLTARLGFFQFTHLIPALRAPFLRGKKRGGGVTAFQAMATALGGSIGTANIAGVAGAILLAGPGAVFWMWIAGLLGMAAKLAEIVLAVKYRDSSARPPAGGPMHYIERGLGRSFRPLAKAYALFGVLAGLLGTALVQSNTIAQAAFTSAADFGLESRAAAPLAGLLTAALTGAVIMGGARRIGSFSAKAVPFMAGAYALCAFAVIFANLSRLPEAFRAIIEGAFEPRGAFCGVSLAALRVGVARGVYSNEAGVGSAAIAHAGSNETDPVKQGLLGIFEVFADTIVTCTLTALVILTSGVPLSGSGMELAGSAFASVFGAGGAGLLLSIAVLLFAFTSLIGWELYYERCAEYLFGPRPMPCLRLLFLLCIPIGAVTEAGLAWTLGELMNYLMALPNTIALALLSGEVKKLVREYGRFEGAGKALRKKPKTRD